MAYLIDADDRSHEPSATLKPWVAPKIVSLDFAEWTEIVATAIRRPEDDSGD